MACYCQFKGVTTHAGVGGMSGISTAAVASPNPSVGAAEESCPPFHNGTAGVCQCGGWGNTSTVGFHACDATHSNRTFTMAAGAVHEWGEGSQGSDPLLASIFFCLQVSKANSSTSPCGPHATFY